MSSKNNSNEEEILLGDKNNEQSSENSSDETEVMIRGNSDKQQPTYSSSSSSSENPQLLEIEEKKKGESSEEESSEEEEEEKTDEEWKEIRKWIQERFHKVICVKYVKGDPLNEERCYCGRSRDEHEDAESSSEEGVNVNIKVQDKGSIPGDISNTEKESNTAKDEEKWNPNIHLVKKETDAFGAIVFKKGRHESRSKKSMYIRLEEDADMEEVRDLIGNIPDVLISIIGDSSIVEKNRMLSEQISDGLTKITNSDADICITEEGTNGCIPDNIGEGTRTIGFAHWGTLYNRKQLIGINKGIKHEENCGLSLNASHTLFFLVDDGYINKDGGGYKKFQRRFEDEMSKTTEGEISNRGLVTIVMNGGPDILTSLLEGFKKENHVPVVVIKGSGWVADILVSACNILGNQDPSSDVDMMAKQEIEDMIKRKAPSLPASKIERVCEDVVECIKKYKKYLFIFGTNQDKEEETLDEVIIRAALEGIRDLYEKFIVAKRLKRLDIAKSIVLVEGQKLEGDYFKKGFKSAMLYNQPDILEILLDVFRDLGNESKDVVGCDDLLDLYKSGKYFPKEDETLDDWHKMFKMHEGILVTNALKYGKEDKNYTCYHVLFLWAVLNSSYHMAYLFLRRDTNILRKAIIGETVCDFMIKNGRDKFRMGDDSLSSFKSDKRMYRDLASNLLREYSSVYEDCGAMLLTYNACDHGIENVSNFEIIIDLEDNEEFIEEVIVYDSSQILMNSLWHGSLYFRDAESSKIGLFMLCILFPPLVMVLMRTNKYECRTKKLIWENEKLKEFFKAPITKFYQNVLSFAIFLILFTHVISYKLQKDPEISEWFLMVWVIALLMDELRQCLRNPKKWVGSPWNWFDIIAMILFFVGFGLRMNGLRMEGRIIYAIDIMLFIIRTLEFFYIDKVFGPYVAMIAEMTQDLRKFMTIVVVIMLAYGNCRDVILNPNTDRSFETFFGSLMVSYFHMYGELFIEYPQSSRNETIFSTENYSDLIQLLVICLMAVYVLVAHALLLNILIAIFNNTYTKVQAKADETWKYKRYQLIINFQNDFAFQVPPISLVFNLCLLVRSIVRCVHDRKVSMKRTQIIPRNIIKKIFERNIIFHYLEDDVRPWLMDVENRCLQKVLQREHNKLHETQEGELVTISNKASNLEKELETISRKLEQNKRDNGNTVELLKQNQKNLCGDIGSLQTDIGSLQTDMNDIKSMLRKIMENQIRQSDMKNQPLVDSKSPVLSEKP